MALLGSTLGAELGKDHGLAPDSPPAVTPPTVSRQTTLRGPGVALGRAGQASKCRKPTEPTAEKREAEGRTWILREHLCVLLLDSHSSRCLLPEIPATANSPLLSLLLGSQREPDCPRPSCSRGVRCLQERPQRWGSG